MTGLASPGQLRASIMRWALFTVPLVMLLGFLSGMLGGDPNSAWFQSLAKPDLFPDPSLFGIVWPILYLLMGISLAIICAAWGARGRVIAIVAFAVQFLLNLAWSPMFFTAHEIKGALVLIGVLDVLVIVTIALFWKVRRLAALLLLPYLAWILFATLLNWQFLQLNPGVSGEEVTPESVQRIEL